MAPPSRNWLFLKTIVVPSTPGPESAGVMSKPWMGRVAPGTSLKLKTLSSTVTLLEMDVPHRPPHSWKQ